MCCIWSAASMSLKKLDNIEIQVLRKCMGLLPLYRWKMGEMPLDFWGGYSELLVILQGQSQGHPIHTLKLFWEKEKGEAKKLWLDNDTESNRTCNSYSTISTYKTLHTSKCQSRYYSSVKAEVAFIVPEFHITVGKWICGEVSIYVGEIIWCNDAILLAIQWIEKRGAFRTIIQFPGQSFTQQTRYLLCNTHDREFKLRVWQWFSCGFHKNYSLPLIPAHIGLKGKQGGNCK